MNYRIYFSNEKGAMDDNVVHLTCAFLKSRRKRSYWYDDDNNVKIDKLISKDSMDNPYIHIRKPNDFDALQLFNDFYEFIMMHSKKRFIIRLENYQGDVLGNKIVMRKKKRKRFCCI